MQLPEELTRRREHSRTRMEALKAKVANAPELTTLTNLCIYVTGSYGRGDAGRESDVDVFFIHRGSEQNDDKITRVQKALADASLIKICRDLGFPEFTKGGQYLDIHYLDDIKKHLGSPEDDYRNFFTARMLLLLESVCILNPGVYEQVIGGILDEYYRDFADHQSVFRPVFLLNDIVRYWKTMCLNYEARRTDKLNSPGAVPELVKNFKLKYSRLLISFSMIVPLIALPDGTSKDEISLLVSMSPFERLAKIAPAGEPARILQELLEEYDWFLIQTENKETLLRIFEDKQQRNEHFTRAAKFGDLMYRLLDAVKRNNEVIRYLIV